MGMNIKSEEAHRLARELAALTGESLTTAVTSALRERLERIEKTEGSGRRAVLMIAIGRELASRFKEPWKSIDHGELLYDELGLPK